MTNSLLKFALVPCLIQLSCTLAIAEPLCVPPNGDVVPWLQTNENAGGHAIACHVGKTEKNLLGRILGQPSVGQTCLSGVEAASTFTDVSMAAKLIAATVTANKAQVDAWLALPRDPLPANLALRGRSDGSSIGFTMSPEAKKGKGTCAEVGGYDCDKAKTFVVYLRRTSAPATAKTPDIACYAVTAFPN